MRSRTGHGGWPALLRLQALVRVPGADGHEGQVLPASAAMAVVGCGNIGCRGPEASRLAPGVVDALVNAAGAKDPYLLGHSQRVADLAASIADTLGLDEGVTEDVRLAGRLQDVGMIGVSSAVLGKPSPLTAAERAQIREHVAIGIEILSPLRTLGPVLQYVHDHHERPDGRGYPRGIAGDAISLGGRILAAADAFDALTTRRPYRDPFTWDEGLTVLAGTVGTALDPVVYDALVNVVATRRVLPFVDDAVGRC